MPSPKKSRTRPKAPTVKASGSAANLPVRVQTKAPRPKITDQAPIRRTVPKAPPEAAAFVCNDCKPTKDASKQLCVCSVAKAREIFDPRFAQPQIPVAPGVRKNPPKGRGVKGLSGIMGGGNSILFAVGLIGVGIFVYSQTRT